MCYFDKWHLTCFEDREYLEQLDGNSGDMAEVDKKALKQGSRGIETAKS